MNWDVLEEDFETSNFEDKLTVLVMYDIIDNKRRNKLSKMLKSFGYRIQKSVFECHLNKKIIKNC